MTPDDRDTGDLAELRDLLERRAEVRDEEVDALRSFVGALPARRRRRLPVLGVLAAAAGVLVVIGGYGLVVALGPLGRSPGAAPQAPDPAAFAGDPRLGVCNTTVDDALAIVELQHVRDYPAQLPKAYPLTGLQADPNAPALVIVRKGPGTPQRAGETPASAAAGSHDLCLVIGADAAHWQPVAVVDVDTTGLLATLPPNGEPSEGRPASATPPTLSPTPSPSSSTDVGLPQQVAVADCTALGFSAPRCLAVVEAAMAQRSLGWADIAAVHLQRPSLLTLGGAPVAEVTFDLVDGSSASATTVCPLGANLYSPVCTEHPQIRLSTPIDGYRDVPCGSVPGGEPGSACATPLPAIDPTAGAVALRVDAADYPLAVGRQEILVGQATLPNGILTDAAFSLADPSTQAFAVDGAVSLEIRSTDPSRPPFTNAYQHGWHVGSEVVNVYLVLDVTTVQPGAMLQVRNLVVR